MDDNHSILQVNGDVNLTDTAGDYISLSDGMCAIVATHIQLGGYVLLGAGGQAPAHNNSAGTVGQVAWDNGYFYVCVATNTWKRVALNLASW
jgi:hypothetical protein